MIQFRRVGLISIGVLCVLAGLVLVYVLVRPGVLGRTSTLQLGLVAGLLVWPGVTYLLMHLDNVAVRRTRTARAVRAQGEKPGRGSRSAA